MSARVKLPDPLNKLLRSQLEKAIYIEVATELGWYLGAVSAHEKYIFQRVADVTKQLYPNSAGPSTAKIKLPHGLLWMI